MISTANSAPGPQQAVSRRARLLRWCAAPAVAVLAAGIVTVAVNEANAATGCRVDYAVNQWSDGFTGNVTVTNLGSPITNWTVEWDFAGNQTISQSWNSTYTQSGKHVALSNASWNGAIGTNATVTAGFSATYSGTNTPVSVFRLNGVSCGGPVAVTTPPTTPPTTAPPSDCPATGRLSYSLRRSASPTAAETDAYNRISSAMDQALRVYNCFLTITKTIPVSYDPNVATADGSYDGGIRFGKTWTMVQATAQHEISHVLGVGTYWNWRPHVVGGRWTGSRATSLIRSLTGNSAAIVNCDNQHFWPYGLNQASEAKSAQDYVNNVKLVVALRQDMGLPV
ncbi:MAG TPA: cellulose-binding domain-containing protein [Actinoplanes sp.]|nr:cellulose-binding domain-containing protein [Actinoplanes sp.]